MNLHDQDRFWRTVAYWMVILLAVKMFSIWYYTARGVGLGYPFDSLVFQTFHRFTDWLIPVDTAHFNNPWSLEEFKEKGLPPTPYSWFAWRILNLTDLLGKKGFYIIVLITYLITLVKILSSNLSDGSDKKLVIAAFIVSCYPLYFLIDRGNVDIVALLFINLYTISSLRGKKNIAAMMLTATACLKPSWILLATPLLFMGPRLIVFSFGVISLIYLIPVLFEGLPLFYMLEVIKAGLPEINAMNYLCSNLSCAIRVFGATPAVYDTAIAIGGILLLIVSVIYIAFRKFSQEAKTDLSLISCIFITMLINNPNSDFRLLLFIPLITIALRYFRGTVDSGSTYFRNFATFSAVCIFGFINIWLRDGVPYFTVLRFLSVCSMSLLLFLVIYRANQSHQ